MASKTVADSVSTRRAEASAWLDSVAGMWHLATMRGTRVLHSTVPGEEEAVPTVKTAMRVFVKGCPLRLMKDVVYLLGVRDTWKDPVIDGVVVPGTWKHKYAYWNRDSGVAENGDATKTLIRDFDEGETSVYAAVEDGCGSRTEVRYVFDAVEVEDIASVEHAGQQGYTVRIGGVSRDRETDLFSYYVTVTERKTHIIAERKIAEDAFSTDYSAEWLGLRGTRGSPEDDSGSPVTVWTASDTPAGTLTTVQWSKNQEDCTWNAQGRKRVSKTNVAAGSGCSKDLFAEQDSAEVSGAAAALGHAPEPADGVVWDYRSRLRQDGKYDNTTVEKTELSVGRARVSKSVDAFTVEESEFHRSQLTELPDPVCGSGVVETVSSEKTPGDLKNVSRNRRTEKEVVRAQVSGERTVFTTRSRTTTKSTASGAPEPSAAGGVGVQSSESVTPGLLKDVTTDTVTELPYPQAQVTRRETMFESETRETDVHSAKSVPEPSVGGGVIVGVDSSVQPYGSRNITKTTTVEKVVGQAQRSVSKTEFEETVEVEGVAAVAVPDPPSPVGGLIRSATSSLTPGGLYRVRMRDSQELEVPSSAKSIVRSPWLTRTTVTDTNTTNNSEISSSPTGFGTVNIQKTPGKLYTRTEGYVCDIQFGTVLSRSKSATAHIRSESRTTIEKSVDESAAGIRGEGTAAAVITSVTHRYEEEGYYLRTTEITRPQPQFYTSNSNIFTDDEGVTWNMTTMQFERYPLASYLNLLRAFNGKKSLKVKVHAERDQFGLWSGGFTFVDKSE